ncbi:MAG: sigma-54-dependent Fis family transcriptional regulator [Pigmentiphaga sp.]|uniref:sigma-54-dependent Fis family transcriptional regulator n=1 Tax=Pigmentiphaga sp. TaxID=1977564 RepID=UPI003B57A67E
MDERVLRSWLRCCESGRAVDEPVAFQPVERTRMAYLLGANAELLDAAHPELTDLARSVADAGYAVLLTDRFGNALAVDGAIAQRSLPLRQAFRAGVDLSESAIGTSAMAVALREAQPARVLGPEHFHTETQMFHCSAAPVFDAQGEVVGSVDVSRDLPGLVDSTLWLAARCAQRIERRLFQRLPAQVHVEIDAGGGATLPAGSGAWLAFGDDGELLAANRPARSLLSLPSGSLVDMDFEQLFGERFGTWVSALRRSEQGASMRLAEGVRLRAVVMGPSIPPTERAGGGRRLAAMPSAAPGAAPDMGDPRLAKAFGRTLRVAAAGIPVLITGETGTGKEVAARALHASGPRNGQPFIALNCAAVPAELLAGELFGHVEGAFTGARRGGMPGKIEAAHLGTLFLDEIGDMPLALQAALLRVLDNGEVVRLGCTRPRPVDLQILCATHRHLPTLVGQGLFREDLMYRVAGHTLHLLPLRERRDFDAVLDSVLQRFGAHPSQLPPGVRGQLKARAWPGNVRELSHAVRRALAFAQPGDELTPDDFAPGLDMAAPRGVSGPDAGLLHQVTQQAIDQALSEAHGNVTEAARRLGMGRATLYRRLRRTS